MKLKVNKIPWHLSWKGLLGTEKAKNIYFQTRFGIHTFGMSYPIDVIVLNNKLEIKKMKKNLMPNRTFFWNPLYENIIELPTGTIKKMKFSIGKIIHLQTF